MDKRTKAELLASIDQQLEVCRHNLKIWQKTTTRTAKAQAKYLEERINRLEQTRLYYA